MLLTMLLTCLGGVIGGRSCATTIPKASLNEDCNVSGCTNLALQAAVAAATAVGMFVRRNTAVGY
jgi:hypothetical protein